MQRQSSIDPLVSTIPAAAEAATLEQSVNEPSSLSQSAAMRVVDAFAETLVIAALLGELGLVLGNVFARSYFHHSFLWAEEVARLSLSILAFVGGAVAYRRRDHAFVRVVLNLVPRPVERTCLALSDIIVLFVVGLTGIASAEFIASSWGERTPIFQIPAALIALPLPLGMALLALRTKALWHLHGYSLAVVCSGGASERRHWHRFCQYSASSRAWGSVIFASPSDSALPRDVDWQVLDARLLNWLRVELHQSQYLLRHTHFDGEPQRAGFRCSKRVVMRPMSTRKLIREGFRSRQIHPRRQ